MFSSRFRLYHLNSVLRCIEYVQIHSFIYICLFFSQCGRGHPHAQIIQICWMIRTFSQLYIFGCHRQCHCMPLSIKVVSSLLLYHFWIAIREYNSNMCSGSYFSDTLPYFSFWIHIRYSNTKKDKKKHMRQFVLLAKKKTFYEKKENTLSIYFM